MLPTGLHTLMAVGLLAATLAGGPGAAVPVAAKTQILAGTTLEADEQIVQEILAVFDRAYKAIESRDLDGLMALYSRSYNYHGLRQSDIRKIWANLFNHYHRIESLHLFTRIVKVGPVPGPPSKSPVRATSGRCPTRPSSAYRSTVGTERSTT